MTVRDTRIASIDKLVVPSGTKRLDLRSNELLDLGSPTKHWPKRLEEIDLANNRLVILRGLGSHEYLHTLDLSFNSLSSLQGLDQLPRLENLNVSHNNLSRVDELGGPRSGCRRSLSRLNASHNSLTQLPRLADCVALRELDLSKNMVAGLGDVPDKLPRSLRVLQLDCNTVGELGELRGLAWLTSLTVATLADNPLVGVAEAHGIHVRAFVAFLLPRLRSLDGRDVAAAEVRVAHTLFRRPPGLSSSGRGGGGQGPGGEVDYGELSDD
eukprot:g2182.t1